MRSIRHARFGLTPGAIALLTAVLSIALVYAGGPDNPPPFQTKPARLDRLAWLQGEWRGDHHGDRLEEIWSAPSGDSMMGMFRWIKGDQVWMFELITITAEGDGVVLRLKHFDHHMVGWEEKGEALTYRLIHHGPREAVFEDPKRDYPRRLAYILDSNDRLTIRLEGHDQGVTKSTTFVFSRN